MTPSFPVKNAVLMMALAAAYPLQAHAAAGITQFTAGDVTLRRGSGTAPLIKGRDLESGDAIVTGPGGRAQIRFSDGGLVALQPDSQFNITNYADRNDPKQDSFLVDLLRGGMRAVTGLIGKRNRENFRVTTQTATVGIRGSAFTLAYNPDGTLSVATELDEIEVCTSAGCVGLKAGEAARVDNNQTLPVRTNARATLDTPAPRQDAQIAGNQVKGDGMPLILGTLVRPPAPAPVVPPKDPEPPVVVIPVPPPVPNPPPIPNPDPVPTTTVLKNQAFAANGINDNDGVYAVEKLYTLGDLELDSAGAPLEFRAVSGEKITRTGTAQPLVSNSSGSVATNDLMAIGSFATSNWLDANGTLNVTQTAFVTGTPTPTSDISALTGVQGRYSFGTATPVFSTVAGRTGELLSDSNLLVSFLGMGNYVTANLNVHMYSNVGSGPQTFAVVSGDSYYNLNGTGVFSRADNGISAGFAGQLSCATGGDFCYSGSFNGFFGGPSASKAGLSFNAATENDGIVNGAAVFNRDNQIPYSAAFVEGAVTGSSGRVFGSGSTYNYYGRNSSGNDSFAFDGNGLSSWTSSDGSNASVTRRTVASDASGSAGDVYNGDYIGWGNWVGGTAYTGGSQDIDSVHYIVGTPTAHMPTTGSAYFSQTGGSAPTGTRYVSGAGSSIITTGTLNAAGSLNVDFTNSKLFVNVSGVVGTETFNTNSAPAYISSGATFASNSSAAVFINGLFTGAGATRAGLVYGLEGSSAVGRITGAVAFEKNTTIPTN